MTGQGERRVAANPFDNPEFREEFTKVLAEALKPLSDHERRISSLEKMGAKAAVCGVLMLAAVEAGWHKLFGGSGH